LKKEEHGELSEDDLKKICSDPIFQEAIYLASPYLYKEIERWINTEENLPAKKNEKLKGTIRKYYNRISHRCTPFGLFSGVGLGSFDTKNIDKFDRESIRDTKLDMHFLVGLAENLSKEAEIRNRLLHFPNNSIYNVGSRIRYIEYEYAEGRREYIISSAHRSPELDEILSFCKTGKTIDQMIQRLVNDEVTSEDVSKFIDELIDNQILVSELEPNVSGEDFLNTIVKVLKKNEADNQIKVLSSIKEKIEILDQNIGSSVLLYSEIEELIKTFETEYEQKYLLQTDLYFKNEYKLPIYWKKELKIAISFLNKLKQSSKESVFARFKKAFNERFETEEVSLAYVMDMEIGIGYKQNIMVKGLHPYLDDLDIPHTKIKSDLNVHLNPVQVILNKKIQECLLEREYTIQLSDEDFKDFEESWSDLPDTLSLMVEIISEGKGEKLFLNGGGGSSAANLSARFCSEKSQIKSFIKAITDWEKNKNPNIILAEIVHLPEARIGNVIRRPLLRDYEIPYLGCSILPKEKQIDVNDLWISIKNDRIVLRSKKLNKEIKPYLTNAHNYSSNSLPVYHFLSDLYSQNSCSGLSFDWGDLENIYHFLPRVEYKNIILSKARWEIRKEDISLLLSFIDDREQFLSALKCWRKKRQIPQWIQWAQSDNTLILNFENYDWAKLFIETIQVKGSIIINEFLYNEKEDFAYQFVFSLHKNQ
jgi:archaellum component FlaC